VTIFLDLVHVQDKEDRLRAIAHLRDAEAPQERFVVDPERFLAIPTAPFAYTLIEDVEHIFASLPRTQSNGVVVAEGLNSTDNHRFLRCWWEVEPTRIAARAWVPLAKGGEYARYYSDLHLTINWEENGRELKALVAARYGSASKRIYGQAHYFKPGLTYSQRSQRGLSFRVLAEGAIFNVKGPAVVGSDNDAILELLGVLNSTCYRALVEIQTSFGSYNVGYLQRTPVPRLGAAVGERLRDLARLAWSSARGIDAVREASHAFVIPALLAVSGDTLGERSTIWRRAAGQAGDAVRQADEEADQLVFEAYGIAPEARSRLFEVLGPDRNDPGTIEQPSEGDTEDDDDDAQPDALDDADLTAALLSWAMGVAFGRFDVRLATGERSLPVEPEPFDPLPVCSPAMLIGEDRLPVASRPPGYPIDFPESGVLVDDPGDPRDLTAAVHAVFDAVFGADADSRLSEAAALLDSRGHDLRAWLRSSFFERHLRLHSKSRRKAPILWQLGTPSGRYSIWLYAHRLSDDTLFQLQNDVLAPKLAYEERQLTNLLQDAGGSPSARERRGIEAQEMFVEELRLLLEEVRKVAPLWRPTLDDGVVLVMAPLWRLVPHKSWQRELKKTWSELADGKYDWAHLAMHLWPERVIRKCVDDCSLAIAHGLEDVLWFEDEDGKWKPREDPTEDVDELIRNRASTAVKDALGATA
jgi:hypothetical protein